MGEAGTQLALALFEDLAVRGEGVAQAPTGLGFRRSNDFVKIVDLSLAGRRLIDVAYFIVSETADIHKEYRVEFNLFKWLLGTSSNNRRHLTKLIREAQKAAIELNEVDSGNPEEGRWGSVPLMGAAFISDGEFTFELAERLQAAIKNPSASHFLSLRYVFKSVHSKVLFDRLQPYVEPGVTPWFDIAALKGWLECDKKTYDHWKHFRAKVLDLALAEIREITGMQVDMITTNVPGSKRIGKVRFRVRAGAQPDEQKLALLILKMLYETLRTEFALGRNEFNEILVSRQLYTDERIQQAMEYTRHQVKLGKVKVRAGGYFMKALREGYLLGELDKQIHLKAIAKESTAAGSAASLDELKNRLDAAAQERDEQTRIRGWEIFQALTPEERAEALQNYAGSTSAQLTARRLNLTTAQLQEHTNHPLVQRSLSMYLAMEANSPVRNKLRPMSSAG